MSRLMLKEATATGPLSPAYSAALVAESAALLERQLQQQQLAAAMHIMNPHPQQIVSSIGPYRWFS